MDVINAVKDTIQTALGADSEVHVLDPRQDGVHLEALVISPSFQGKSLIQQQKLVMQALKEQFSSSLHALGLRTFTPDQWQTARSNYGL